MVTIKSIYFVNFKRFERFNVSCRKTNIFVGPNNAGKSTTLDALRILKDCLRFANRNRPSLLDQGHAGVCASYNIPHSLIGISPLNVVTDYGDEPAEIDIKLTNGTSVHIRLHPEISTLAFIQTEGRIPTRIEDFRRSCPLKLTVVPTLSAFEENEPYLQDETVSRNENTRLASRNFRNIIYRLDEEKFQLLNDAVNLAWPNIELRKPFRQHGKDSSLNMMYAENRIEREIYWSGFGFQIWLQIMLQILRSDKDSLIIIDEPDIYLHPDLQRRLLNICKDKFAQIFIATHSTEIINEAESGDILLVDSRNTRALRVNKDDEYKRLYSYIGSSENAEFAKIARAKRIIFFEGQDRNIIRKISRKIGKSDTFDDPYTVYLQTGGFAQWERVREIDWSLHNIFGLDIKVGALFDRDYRCEAHIADFIASLATTTLWVSVLERKEIENYALEIDSLKRLILKRSSERGFSINSVAAEQIIIDISSRFKDECRAQLTANYLSFHSARDKSTDSTTHIHRTMEYFDTKWNNIEDRIKILPGKQFISTLSALTQRDFKFSITINQMIDEMNSDEVSDDMKLKLESLRDFFQN